MNTTSRLAPLALSLSLSLAAASCLPTGHAVAPAALGTPSRASAFEAQIDAPGPVVVETVVAATWKVDRSGLINLDHPAAKAAGLVEGREPIHLAFHALHHRTKGTYLVDSGVERAFVSDPGHALISGFMGSLAHLDELKVLVDTRTWIERQPKPPLGVFLTHLHLDHVMGLRDLPAATTVFVGPGETAERTFENLFTGSLYDASLGSKGVISEWTFTPDPEGAFDGVLDVFGDGSLWAIWVPGHTAGSTAFLARTPAGPVLLTGDACHTRWGWDHGVEPGTFSHDKPKSAQSLQRLKALVARHPAIEVRLGHQ
jgi:glyoxylase-like metal-dependent hydrolase (beta-lactamase superfamily II)